MEPATVQEGGTVQVTVTRDAAVGPSQIDIESIDESARAGPDYEAVDRTIEFTNDVSQTFPVPIADDAAEEPAETFRLHLSDPGGCTVNPNFQVGPDATVTIASNDSSAPPPPTAAPSTTRRPGETTSSAAAESSTTAAPPDASDETAPEMLPGSAPDYATDLDDSTTTDVTDGEVTLPIEDDDGGNGLIIALAVAGLVAAAGAGGWFAWRRRLPPTVP